MKILILTQYFPPETGAAQNRLLNLALHLKQKGAEVSVLTAMPNYPSMKIREEYRGKFFVREDISGIRVSRVWLWTGTSRAIMPRLFNYFSFVITSFFAGWFRTGRFDYLICESPPLFLGISGYLLSRIKRSRLIFNVSDLWPESAEKLGLVTNSFLLGISTSLEEFLYRKSYIVSGQTKGIVNNISARFPEKEVFWLKNGAVFRIEEKAPEFLNFRGSNQIPHDSFVLLYAGILGHAQGLEVILKAADILRDVEDIHFVMIGDGPVKDQLESMKNEKNLQRVHFLPPVPKDVLNAIVSEIDVAIIPLKKIDLFLGAIPSKIFDNLFLKKPILLGVEGEARELFIDDAGAGLAFRPEDPADLVDKIRQFYGNRDLVAKTGEAGYFYMKKHFNWDNIITEFWQKLEK